MYAYVPKELVIVILSIILVTLFVYYLYEKTKFKRAMVSATKKNLVQLDPSTVLQEVKIIITQNVRHAKMTSLLKLIQSNKIKDGKIVQTPYISLSDEQLNTITQETALSVIDQLSEIQRERLAFVIEEEQIDTYITMLIYDELLVEVLDSK